MTRVNFLLLLTFKFFFAKMVSIADSVPLLLKIGLIERIRSSTAKIVRQINIGQAGLVTEQQVEMIVPLFVFCSVRMTISVAGPNTRGCFMRLLSRKTYVPNT